MSHEGQIHEVVLDIETYADITPEQLERMAADVEAPKNWKDPEKIAAYIEKKKAEIVEKAALSPRTGKVVCVGLALRRLGVEGAPWELLALSGADEAVVLQEMDLALHAHSVSRVITFNGKRFDIPFLVARLMRQDQCTAFKLPIGHDKRHVDLWEVLTSWGKGVTGGLGAWSDAILGEPHDQYGSDVAGMVDAGAWGDLESYCLQDVRHTAVLYDRMLAVTGGV